MTRKLVNIKNFLRIIISCFVIVNMAKSCAKAYDDSIFSLTKTQIDANLDLLVEENAIPQAMATYVKNSYNSVSSSFVGYFIMKTTTYYYFTWFLKGNGATITNYSNDTHNTSYNMWKGCSSGLRFNLNGNYSSNGNFPYNSQTIEYCFTTVPINTRSLVMTERGEFGNSFFPSFNLHFMHGFSEDFTLNGETIQAVQLNYNNSKVFIEDIAPTERCYFNKSLFR